MNYLKATACNRGDRGRHHEDHGKARMVCLWKHESQPGGVPAGSSAWTIIVTPGHRERSPAPGSHRTWRAVFASLHLRCPAPRSSTGGSQHFAAIRSRFVSTVSFILSLHRGLSLPLHGARVAPERVICRQPLPPVNGSPVLRVLSTGLTSARPSDRPCLGGLSGPTGLRLNRTDLPCSRQVLRLHASGTNPGSVPAHSPYRGTEMQPSP